MKNKLGQEFAFPRIVPDGDKRQAGMTLRQYYAGQAMAGMLAQMGQPYSDPKEYGIGKAAVAYADDLIEALSKQP